MNGSTSDSNVTIPLSVKASFCVTMPLITGDEEFCNITEVWKPRYTSSALWIVPTFLAVLITLLSWVVFFRRGKVEKNYHPLRTKPRLRLLAKENPKPSCLDNFPGVTAIRTHYNRIDENISVLALLVGTQIWEIFDVYKDSRYFYDIEASGSEVLSINIYRNTTVSDAIYTLALVGVLKIPLSIFVMCELISPQCFDSDHDQARYQRYLNYIYFKNKWFSASIAMIAFVFEDCAEAFLEYFYVEKYSMNGNFALYMIIADVVMSVVLLYSGMKYSSTWKTGIKLMCREPDEDGDFFPIDGLFPFTFCGCYILMAIANVIRTYGALFQAVTGKLDVGCLAVESGRLIQTPFTTGGQCMRHAEYAMIFFNFAPLFWLILIVTVLILIRPSPFFKN